MFSFRRRSAVDRLVQGYRQFRRTKFLWKRNLYKRLTKGQHPKVMIIACSDSRVSPTAVLNTGPGEVFIARNVANIVPPHDPDAAPRSLAAAIEFAVKVLRVEHIVVMGHGRCGGVAALVSHGRGLPETQYLQPWVDIAAPALDLLPDESSGMTAAEVARASEYAVVKLSLKNLQTYPWVRERMEGGKLSLHGWHFAIFDGALVRLNPDTDQFEAVPV
ncbi:MAG: carbonic anhydrase [Alphaproteobacteria bacterium]|nr:carbonic anhydrase [Alphaproteobacteria bacterium]